MWLEYPLLSFAINTKPKTRFLVHWNDSNARSKHRTASHKQVYRWIQWTWMISQVVLAKHCKVDSATYERFPSSDTHTPTMNVSSPVEHKPQHFIVHVGFPSDRSSKRRSFQREESKAYSGRSICWCDELPTQIDQCQSARLFDKTLLAATLASHVQLQLLIQRQWWSIHVDRLRIDFVFAVISLFDRFYPYYRGIFSDHSIGQPF